MLRVLLFIIFLSHPLFAFDIPSHPDGYVTDRAAILSPQSREELEGFLRNYEQQTSNQVIVATFPSMEGGSLEETSMQLAEKWHVGQKGRDNGVLFLIFLKDRKVRIEVGYGLEGVLPDALAGQIIQEIVAPLFREGKFDEGILQGTAAIVKATQGEYKGLPQNQLDSAQALAFFRLIAALVAVLFVVDSIRYLRYRSQYKSLTGRYTFVGWWFRFAILFFLLNVIFRMIFYSMLFSRGGSYGSRSGFGGFSGGGGSFGGGGASGGW